MKRSSVMPKHRKAEYIFSIIANLVFLWFLSQVPEWELPFLRGGYMVILIIMQVNCVLQIAANIAMYIFDTIFFRHLVKIILDSANIVIMGLIYIIFPFSFSQTGYSWVESLIPILLVIGVLLTGVSIISNIFKMLAREEELI